MKRKDFLRNSAAAAIGISLLHGCNKEDTPEIQTETPPFPYLEVNETSNYDIGYKIGEHFKMQFNEVYARNEANKVNNPDSPFNGMDLLSILMYFVEGDPDTFYNPFLSAAEERYNNYVEEVRGLAEGSGIPFKKMFVNLCVFEILGKLGSEGQVLNNEMCATKGCSSVTFSKDSKLFLAHNEDLSTANADLMYVVKVIQPGKPAFMGLNYPGMILGVPPSTNEAGMMFTGNQVDIPVSSDGVPWVFLCRAMQEAQTIDEVKSILQFPGIGYSAHFNIGSLSENRIISAEVMPGKHEFYEVDNFYVHTNHFVLPTMKDDSIIGENTTTRYNLLKEKSGAFTSKPDEVTGDLITSWMSSHDGHPHSVCVHSAEGLTLAHSLFDFQKKTWKLYRGNPCNNAYKTLQLPISGL
ncbi:MAG: C45 family peptidase [Bacteroidota bacterium]|nr:C45 family peptidase [Bacteroidota bacterium]